MTRASIRHPALVILLALLLTGAALVFTARNFSINTNTARLISSDTPWRQDENAFDAAFPIRTDLIVAIIDAPTPEEADDAASRLVARLRAEPVIRSVRQPDAGSFFDRNGLLLLKAAEFRTTLAEIVRQQPLLATLAADPGLGGVLAALRLGAKGVTDGEATLEDLVRPLDAISAAIEASAAGPLAPVSWQALLAKDGPSRRDLRRFVLIQPVLDFAALEPGAEGIATVRRSAREIGIGPGTPTTFRLTGPVPLADEEFATVAEGALVNTLATIAVVLALLFAALRSARLVLAVMTTLLVGLAITAGLGLAIVGEYNLISVAFAVLFVGLGVDFSIQLVVRYREIRHRVADLTDAVREASGAMRRPLLLAAASTAIGFLSFLPTPFRGVSELGFIAGLGMLVALVASLTLLPALLIALRLPKENAPVGYPFLAGADRFVEHHRRAILLLTGAIFLAGLPLLTALRFDSDPMNLRDPHVESVATFHDLARDPETTPQTLDLIVPDIAAAKALAARLVTLPEVRNVTGLATFLPEDQAERLGMIEDAAFVMDTVLDPVAVKPPRDRAALEAEIRSTRAELLALAAGRGGDASLAALFRAGAALEALEIMPEERYGRAEQAIIANIAPLLGKVRAAFEAGPITLEALPESLRADWVATDGRTRLEIRPAGDMTDPVALLRFVEAVRVLAPGVTGVPVTIVESGRTVVQSFLIAALIALVSITLLLVVLLRNFHDVLVTLVPLVIAVLMSLQAAVLIDLPLNFANIIALPLMCGVSVAFHIYFVLAWRRGIADVLASSLTRAILFSALTTAAAFGSLWLSSHPGTASMGKLLTLSLAFTLLAAFVFVPAFLGPPPQPASRSE
jgi:hypothetical protein